MIDQSHVFAEAHDLCPVRDSVVTVHGAVTLRLKFLLGSTSQTSVATQLLQAGAPPANCWYPTSRDLPGCAKRSCGAAAAPSSQQEQHQ